MGFVLMYYIGKLFGEKILRSGKLKFIDPQALYKVDVWFRKHGYKLVLANRFLPGTRSVISFFSGMHELRVGRTFIYSAISAFLWNGAIIFAGMKIGENADKIDYYLTAYSNIIIALTLLVFAVLVFRFFFKRIKK
jgi:membrane protein DedA with SNARE-associated domain